MKWIFPIGLDLFMGILFKIAFQRQIMSGMGMALTIAICPLFCASFLTVVHGNKCGMRHVIGGELITTGVPNRMELPPVFITVNCYKYILFTILTWTGGYRYRRH